MAEIILTDSGKRIIESINNVVPNLSEMEKEKLLSFMEGMVFMKEKQGAKEVKEGS